MRTEELRRRFEDYERQGIISSNFKTFILYANRITGNGERAVEFAKSGKYLLCRIGLSAMRVNLNRMKRDLPQTLEPYKILCEGMEDLCLRYEENFDNTLNKMESLTAK